MKKFVSLLTVFVLIANIGLFAEGTVKSEATGSTIPETSEITPALDSTTQSTSGYSTIGTAAAKSSQAGRTTSWQNWVFAGTALVLATIGIVVVTINSGKNSPTDQ